MHTQRHRWADVLIAIAEGKEVEMLSCDGQWILTKQGYGYKTPISFPEYEWRVRVEPVIKIQYRFLTTDGVNRGGLTEHDNWNEKLTFKDNKLIERTFRYL